MEIIHHVAQAWRWATQWWITKFKHFIFQFPVNLILPKQQSIIGFKPPFFRKYSVICNKYRNIKFSTKLKHLISHLLWYEDYARKPQDAMSIYVPFLGLNNCLSQRQLTRTFKCPQYVHTQSYKINYLNTIRCNASEVCFLHSVCIAFTLATSNCFLPSWGTSQSATQNNEKAHNCIAFHRTYCKYCTKKRSC